MSVLIVSIAFAVIVTIDEGLERWKIAHARVKVYRPRPRRFD